MAACSLLLLSNVFTFKKKVEPSIVPTWKD